MSSDDAHPWPLEHNALTGAVSSLSSCIPCGRGAGGEGGVGDLGLRCLGVGGVGGMRGERGCIRECVGAVGCSRGRLLAPAGPGIVLLPRHLRRVSTLWCPHWQQCRTPRCMRVQRGHSGSPCTWQTLDGGLRSTYPGAWCPLAQHVAADRRRRLHVTHAGNLWAGHA